MIELLIFIAGIVAIIAFRASIKTSGLLLDEHSKVWAEDQLVDIADKRQEVNKRADVLIEKHGKIVSHEELMAKLGYKQ